jgi:hypothetical protein
VACARARVWRARWCSRMRHDTVSWFCACIIERAVCCCGDRCAPPPSPVLPQQQRPMRSNAPVTPLLLCQRHRKRPDPGAQLHPDIDRCLLEACTPRNTRSHRFATACLPICLACQLPADHRHTRSQAAWRQQRGTLAAQHAAAAVVLLPEAAVGVWPQHPHDVACAGRSSSGTRHRWWCGLTRSRCA